MSDKEIAEVKPTNVVAFDTSILLEDAGTASENMTADDMLIPRLRILQSGSPQVKKSEGAYIKGAEEGHIFDNVTNELFDGEKGITVVPITFRKTYIEWTDDRKFVGDHGININVSNCVLDDKYKLRNPEGNVMTLTAEYLVYVIDKNGNYSPALISMSSSALKKSKRWNSMMNRLMIADPNKAGSMFNPAMFWTAYKITSVPESNDSGAWMNWEIEMIYDADSGGIIQNLPNGGNIYLQARDLKSKAVRGEVRIQPDTPEDDVM